MVYEDELIALRRYEEKKQKYYNTKTGMYAGERLITFKYVPLFDNKVKIMLPDDFEDMEFPIAKKKYSSEEKADIIKTNKEGTVDFTFTLLEGKYSIHELRQTTDKLKNILKGVLLSAIFGEKGAFESEIKEGCWFTFQSFSLNGAIYNFLCISTAGNISILNMFNCEFEHAGQWKPIFEKVAETIDTYE